MSQFYCIYAKRFFSGEFWGVFDLLVLTKLDLWIPDKMVSWRLERWGGQKVSWYRSFLPSDRKECGFVLFRLSNFQEKGIRRSTCIEIAFFCVVDG